VAVGIVPDDLQTLIGVDQQVTVAVDWNKATPLLQHVELRELAVIDRPQYAQGRGERDVESVGYEVLAHGQLGPLILRRIDGPKHTYVFTFHTDRSELPYRVGFPVMVSNMVRIAMDNSGLAETQAPRTGVLPPLAAAPAKTYRVKGPDGKPRDETSDPKGLLTGVPAATAGRYEVSGDALSSNLGVSLLDERESSLGTVDTLQFEEVAVSAAQNDTKADKPLWPLLAMLALGVLVIEWWFYQRRPRIPGAPGVPA
jgi:Ca-activated chloride channel homolog